MLDEPISPDAATSSVLSTMLAAQHNNRNVTSARTARPASISERISAPSYDPERVASSRNNSPADRCKAPNILATRSQIVPFPAPGLPRTNTTGYISWSMDIKVTASQFATMQFYNVGNIMNNCTLFLLYQNWSNLRLVNYTNFIKDVNIDDHEQHKISCITNKTDLNH